MTRPRFVRFSPDSDQTTSIERGRSRANTGSRESSGGDVRFIATPPHSPVRDDAVGFFDAATAVHENFGA